MITHAKNFHVRVRATAYLVSYYEQFLLHLFTFCKWLVHT